jgi:hypothetical protein
MILILLWALVGCLFGYEAARHGVVQVIVPTLYLLGVFVWLIAGLVLIHFATTRRARRAPSAQEMREAWTKLSESQRRDVNRGEAGK